MAGVALKRAENNLWPRLCSGEVNQDDGALLAAEHDHLVSPEAEAMRLGAHLRTGRTACDVVSERV